MLLGNINVKSDPAAAIAEIDRAMKLAAIVWNELRQQDVLPSMSGLPGGFETASYGPMNNLPVYSGITGRALFDQYFTNLQRYGLQLAGEAGRLEQLAQTLRTAAKLIGDVAGREE